MKMLLLPVGIVLLLLVGAIFIFQDYRNKSLGTAVLGIMHVVGTCLVAASLYYTHRQTIETKRANLEALKWEISFNAGLFNDVVRKKEQYLSGEKINLMPFQIEVYRQGTTTHFLNEATLIQEILQFYADLQTANRAMDLAGAASVLPLADPYQIVKRYNEVVVNVAEKHYEKWQQLVEKLDEILSGT